MELQAKSTNNPGPAVPIWCLNPRPASDDGKFLPNHFRGVSNIWFHFGTGQKNNGSDRSTTTPTWNNVIRDVQQSFTDLSNDYIVFGLGKHACPGRFFAALKIKATLSEILLNYDIAFPDGASTMPKPMAFNIFTIPSPTAKLVFTMRL
ncbi:hypothetical protein C8J57DRAFT_1510369 [Mycena rebaudengoi]|nr:hypothetical protein C8J57DRAFT_1510369 [Mycena rebaudengoi]